MFLNKEADGWLHFMFLLLYLISSSSSISLGHRQSSDSDSSCGSGSTAATNHPKKNYGTLWMNSNSFLCTLSNQIHFTLAAIVLIFLIALPYIMDTIIQWKCGIRGLSPRHENLNIAITANQRKTKNKTCMSFYLAAGIEVKWYLYVSSGRSLASMWRDDSQFICWLSAYRVVSHWSGNIYGKLDLSSWLTFWPVLLLS